MYCNYNAKFMTCHHTNNLILISQCTPPVDGKESESPCVGDETPADDEAKDEELGEIDQTIVHLTQIILDECTWIMSQKLENLINCLL